MVFDVVFPYRQIVNHIFLFSFSYIHLNMLERRGKEKIVCGVWGGKNCTYHTELSHRHTNHFSTLLQLFWSLLSDVFRDKIICTLHSISPCTLILFHPAVLIKLLVELPAVFVYRSLLLIWKKKIVGTVSCHFSMKWREMTKVLYACRWYAARVMLFLEQR